MTDINQFLGKLFGDRNEMLTKIEPLKTSGNLSFNLETNKSKYIVRLCGDGARFRNQEDIISEAILLGFLNNHNIPVPKPIVFNKRFAISFDNKNGICYQYIGGKNLEICTPQNCFEVGKMLGSIHNKTENFVFPFKRKKWDINSTKIKLKELKKVFNKDNFLKKNRFVERTENILKQLEIPENLPTGAIHEDLGQRHVLFHKNKIVGIIDWDRSYSGQFILDIGQAVRGWCFDNWKVLNNEKLNNFLEGYQSERVFSKQEYDCLLDSIKFAFVERAISFAIFAIHNKEKEHKMYAVEDLKLIENLVIPNTYPI
jgi:Ser/Thr protein kinase RdoA (MazF antagonist)